MVRTTDDQYVNPVNGHRREIGRYPVRSNQHPTLTWLLKCPECHTYRDRDTLWGPGDEGPCLPCKRKAGHMWDFKPSEYLFVVQPKRIRNRTQSTPQPKPAPARPARSSEEINQHNAKVLAQIGKPSSGSSGMDAVRAFMEQQKRQQNRS